VTEPHGTTIVVAVGSISLVTGTILGLPVAAVAFGFLGGLAALKIEAPASASRSLWAKVTTAALGTVAASVSAHPLAEILHPANTPTEMWVPLAAFVTGAGAELLLRALLLGLTHRIRQAFGIAGTNNGERE
jgi:hypothetical protein